MEFCKYSGKDCAIKLCEDVNCSVAKELDRIKSQKGLQDKSPQNLDLGLPLDISYSCSNINSCSNSSDKCQMESYRDSCIVKSDFQWGKHGVGF